MDTLIPPGNWAVPAFVTGLTAEARIARHAGWPVAAGGGTTAGAYQAARRLLENGATGLVSFGLAGGLDPALPPGTLIVAKGVIAMGRIWRTDAALNARLGGVTDHLILALDRIAASANEKLALGDETGAVAADMESEAVVAAADAAGLPFAVLRAICDPAERDLPPAAIAGLDAHGRIAAWAVAGSILRHPGQIAALICLARDAAAARRALAARIAQLAVHEAGGHEAGGHEAGGHEAGGHEAGRLVIPR